MIAKLASPLITHGTDSLDINVFQDKILVSERASS
jgi:hypothetical protein